MSLRNRLAPRLKPSLYSLTTGTGMPPIWPTTPFFETTAATAPAT